LEGLKFEVSASRYSDTATAWRPRNRNAIPGKAGNSSVLKSVQSDSLT